MTVYELTRLDGFSAAALPQPERTVGGVYIGDLLSWVMGRAREGDAWITIMSNKNVPAVASLCDAACVVLAEAVSPEEDMAALAAEKGVNVLVSTHSAYETALLLHAALRHDL